MSTSSWKTALGVALASIVLAPGGAAAQWAGLVDRSSELMTDSFPFFGSHPEAGGNENYYDGDLGDFDGDGLADRLLGARYGLLFNTGGGRMVPIRRQVGMLLRGDPGASGWGEDAMALVDVDGDGDLDALSGGNGEPLSAQLNDRWRFRHVWNRGSSALNIVPTDLEGDGDVDLFVAHAFCATASCGGPVNFDVLVNDGTGTYTEEASARGLGFGSGDFITGVVSGDVDGDGDFDAVIMRGTATEGAVIVAFNDGAGSFTQSPITMPIACSGFGQSITLGDIDDDGDLDLGIGRCIGEPGATEWVSGTYTGGHPVVAHLLALNDGAGDFTDVSATHFDATAFSGAQLAGSNASFVDIDHDGDLDFVALRKTAGFVGLDTHHLQIYLNDGTGHMTYRADRSHEFPGRTSGLGADVDISDLDRDGDYDLWLGFGSDNVRIFMNQHVDPGGLPADMPRSLRVVSADAGGITIGWMAPPMAANSRRYRVFRSLARGVEDRDRELLHTVGHSAHLDQDFFGTIDRHTTTADLGDPAVEIDASTGEVRFTDTTAVPGVTYYYTVAHVGPEHTQSVHAPEVAASTPAPSGADSTGPELSIVSPTADDWQRSPRIVIGYGDGGSGVDPSTLRVSFDTALGPLAADADLSSMAYRHDASGFVAFLAPPHELPADTLVTLTATVSDRDGNSSTETVQFFNTISSALAPSPSLPTASFTASATSGMGPLDVDLDASASDDSDGQIMRWEWYFGDGSTGLGRQIDHTFQYAGSYDVTLVVRDNEGGVATTTTTITVTGDAPPADGGFVKPDGGVVVPGGDGGAPCTMCGGTCVDTSSDPAHCGGCDRPCAGGETCFVGECRDPSTIPDAGPGGGGDDAGCGCSAPGGGGSIPGWPLALLGLWFLPRSRRRP